MRKKAVFIGVLAGLASSAQAATVVGTFAAALTDISSSTFGIQAGSTLTNAGAFITGTTGDFAGIASGTTFTFAPVTAANGANVSFASSFGSFTGSILNMVQSPAPFATLNFDVLGSFTPSGALSSFMEGAASLTVSFTQTGNLVAGQGQPAISASFSFASPPVIDGGGNPGAVPEPAAWAMLIAGFGMTGAAMRRRQARVLA